MLPVFLTIENDGERQTAEQIWKRHKSRMYIIARKILNSDSDAEDAVMDAVRNIMRNIKKFVDLTEIDTICLITIYVKHAAFKIYDRNKEFFEHMMDSEIIHKVSEIIDIEEIVITKDKYEALSKELQKMSGIYSYPFILRYHFQFSIKEISSMLDLKEDTVKKRLYRAKQMLLKSIGDCNEQEKIEQLGERGLKAGC